MPDHDAECVHCGKAHASFGLLPLCATCTRAHAAALPRAARVSPRLGADDLRRATTMANACDESFLDRFTAEEIIALYRALQRSEWDVYPDKWSQGEVRAALAGHGTGATSAR